MVPSQQSQRQQWRQRWWRQQQWLWRQQWRQRVDHNNNVYMAITYVEMTTTKRWYIRGYADAFGAVGEFNMLISNHPVHAQLLGLLCLSRRVVCSYTTQQRMIDVEPGRQRVLDVKFTMSKPTAHGTRQVAVIIKQTCPSIKRHSR